MVKLLHCADLHMGAAFPETGRRRGNLLREAQRNTWQKTLGTAAEEKVDLVLVAGDLFDSNHISGEALDFFFESMGRCPLPICILPGTHDPYDRYSVYRDGRFGEYKNLFVFNEKRNRSFVFSGLDLTVHAQALLPGEKKSPLHGLIPSKKTRFNVAMAHGVLDKNHRCPDDCCFGPDEIEKSGMDYIALGHDHSFRECSAGGTKAYYSGPLETLKFGQEGGWIILVALGGETVEATAKRIGRYRWEELSLSPGEMSTGDMAQKVRTFRGEDRLLRVRFSGEIPFHAMADLEGIAEKLSGEFFYLDFSYENLSIKDELPGDLPPDISLPGEYQRLLRAKLKEADGENKGVCEEALWRGYQLLTEE